MKQILTILLFCVFLCQFGCAHIDPDLIRRAEQGDKVAQNDLGHEYAYCEGFIWGKDAKAVKWYRMSAEQGYAPAQTALGLLYYGGVDTVLAKNYDEALKWFRLAADQGYAKAQNRIGMMYELGQGVPQDYAEAAKWYRMAVEQGYPAAQCNLGIMYLLGHGVPPNNDEALKWLRLAAEQGYEDAKSQLDDINEFEKNLVTARQGDPSAQNVVGIMYDEGIGVAQNFGEATRWYRMAAEQRYAQAQSNLATSYWNGKGTTKDEVEALAWLYVANSNPRRSDVSNLSQNIASLERRVGPDGRQAAQQRAKQISTMLQSKR